MTEQSNSRPVRTLRSGPVSCAVWENSAERDGKTIMLNNLTFQRSYRDAETGEWKTSSSFSPQSLGNLLMVVLRATIDFCRMDENVDETEEQIPI